MPLQISSIPGSVGDSLIQLNRADCHVKLAFDLLYLFVYKPTPQLMLPVAHMASLYQQCHGHKLIPAVYGMKSLLGLIESAKPVSQLIKVHMYTYCICTYTCIHMVFCICTCIYMCMSMYLTCTCTCVRVYIHVYVHARGDEELGIQMFGLCITWYKTCYSVHVYALHKVLW